MIILESIITKIKERAKNNIKTIVLPETMDRRTLEATEIILKEKIANIILIGTPEEINANGKNLNLEEAKIINPYESELTKELINDLYELRKEKGMTEEKAEELLDEIENMQIRIAIADRKARKIAKKRFP